MKRHTLFKWAVLLCWPWAVQAADPHELNHQALYRRLDRLQALGVGLRGQQAPKPPTQPEQSRTDEPDTYTPTSRMDIEQRTIRDNAAAMGRLKSRIDELKAHCGSRWHEYPELGMSDEAFRTCTLHAHFGNLTQVVVSQEGKAPLRLYVFATERAHKVYTIDGVVTAIQP
jgi:hypothetical protein